MLVELHRVAFDPWKEISFISNEYNKFEMEGSPWRIPASLSMQRWASSVALSKSERRVMTDLEKLIPQDTLVQVAGETIAISPQSGPVACFPAGDCR